MYLPRVKSALLLSLITWGGTVLAQTSSTSNPTNGRENNPYSKYGIGELTDGNTTVLRGMGSVSSAFVHPYVINTDNPASYSFLQRQRTTFELGVTGSTRTLNSQGLTYQTGTASISYMALAMPVSKKAGLCIGFRPYSKVYYSMVDTIGSNSNPPSPIGQVINNYNGEGGLNMAYLGGAYRIKGLSIGVNVGYMFGSIRSTTATIPIDTDPTNRAFTAQYTNYTKIGGIYWKAGLVYERKLDTASNYVIRIGATFALNQNLDELLNAYQISSYNFGDTITNDTVVNSGEKHGQLTMPTTYSVGVMLAKGDKWNVGVDYTATQWSGYRSTADSSLASGVGSGSYRISVGGSYTPDAMSIRNYFSRVTYRVGFYYGNNYLNLNGNVLPVYGATLGGTFPFKRVMSGLFAAMHCSLDVGKLGLTKNNLIEETYVRFTVGLSLNDRWFIPRKYD